MKKILLIALLASANALFADTTTNINDGVNVVAKQATNFISVTVTNTSPVPNAVSLWNNPTLVIYAVQSGLNDGGRIFKSHPIGKYYEVTMPPNSWMVIANPGKMSGLTVSNSQPCSVTLNSH